MLTEKEVELFKYMDYQVLNNGMDGWIANGGYVRVFEFIDIIRKRNSDLDQRVANIFITATISALRSLQHKDASYIPEIRDIINESEKQIEEVNLQYSQLANEFMESYGLEDYLTYFGEKFV